MSLTPLEVEIFERLYDSYAEFGFPEPTDISCVGRRNLGLVHYSDLQHLGEFDAPDGGLVLGTFSHVEFASLPCGAYVEVTICSKKLKCIVFWVVGERDWDGDQSGWKIISETSGGEPSPGSA